MTDNQKLTFVTPRGAAIIVSLDDTTITVTANGKPMQLNYLGSFDMPVFPDIGTCIAVTDHSGKGVTIMVPSDKVAAVRALKEAREVHRHAAWLKSERGNADTERACKERAWDKLHNEGTREGYNPFRRDTAEDAVRGTALDRNERHLPDGA